MLAAFASSHTDPHGTHSFSQVRHFSDWAVGFRPCCTLGLHAGWGCPHVRQRSADRAIHFGPSQARHLLLYSH